MFPSSRSDEVGVGRWFRVEGRVSRRNRVRGDTGALHRSRSGRRDFRLPSSLRPQRGEDPLGPVLPLPVPIRKRLSRISHE